MTPAERSRRMAIMLNSIGVIDAPAVDVVAANYAAQIREAVEDAQRALTMECTQCWRSSGLYCRECAVSLNKKESSK